eukprot:SAG31_NODE_9105_length_1333_cov_6.670178_1_plen_97_part_00
MADNSITDDEFMEHISIDPAEFKARLRRGNTVIHHHDLNSGFRFGGNELGDFLPSIKLMNMGKRLATLNDRYRAQLNLARSSQDTKFNLAKFSIQI